MCRNSRNILNIFYFWVPCIELLSFSAVVNLLVIDSSMYDSATVELFHPPCLFRAVISPPASISIVAEERRNECPEYFSGLGNYKKDAIFLPMAVNLFFAIFCAAHFPF